MITARKATEIPWFSGSICSRCLRRLSTPGKSSSRFQSSASTSQTVLATAKSLLPRSLRREYFSANGILDKNKKNAFNALWRDAFKAGLAGKSGHGGVAQVSPIASIANRHDDSQETVPPHTEAMARYDHEISTIPERLAVDDMSTAIPTTAPPAHAIPLDASSRLSTRAANLPPTSLRRLMTTYLSLSKPRLSFLVVLTATSVYTLYPVPALLLPATTASPSLSALTLVFLTTGTGLCAASANAFNMLIEPEHDAKMSRTRNRPLVRGLISSRGALLFAVATGALGTLGLYVGVNPTVSFLGALNILVYAGIYTPMKRLSVLNTWVGAVVGAIPPLMGWAAAAGQSASSSGSWQELLLGEENIGGWLFAALLFAWQFPHFNALSWTIRAEYKHAGYRMMAWVNEARNGRVALRYAILFFPICAGLSWAGVTDPGFVVTSSVVNAWVVHEAWKFWKLQGRRGSARGLFWAGVWQLPALMVLAMVHKKGLWDGAWSKVFGEEHQGEKEGDDNEDEEGLPDASHGEEHDGTWADADKRTAKAGVAAPAAQARAGIVSSS